MSDERTLQALRALAENDRACEASPGTEARLRRAFRRNRAQRARRRRAVWSGAVVAAVAAAILVAVIQPRSGGPPLAPLAHPSGTEQNSEQAGAAAETRALHRASRPPSRSGNGNAVPPPAKSSPAQPAKPRLVPQVPRRAVLAKASPSTDRPEAPAEMVTDFFPLLDPAPPFERGEILRVNIPASAMQAVGLPVRDERLGDRVQADVLVGEEGLPRAIRFVRTDMH
ncbi:MAG TPA: hypothetical protein VGR73_11335 [Bryobacteraceae bacterium]|nr:hypothetical protein [Bryobacteraceae bacterium]